MSNTIELVPELLEAGVHFGHQTKRWNPKMKPFIFEKRNAIYIINLDEGWIGGTVTDLATIRKSIGRLKYIEEIEASPDYKKMGKQELAALNREAAKLRRNLEGILEMSQLPDALIIIDTTREQNAVNEARRLGIPTVAIVDTNADPEIIDYPIPGNDDAIRAIRVMLQKLVDAIVSASGEARMGEEVERAGEDA